MKVFRMLGFRTEADYIKESVTQHYQICQFRPDVIKKLVEEKWLNIAIGHVDAEYYYLGRDDKIALYSFYSIHAMVSELVLTPVYEVDFMTKMQALKYLIETSSNIRVTISTRVIESMTLDSANKYVKDFEFIKEVHDNCINQIYKN